MDSPLFLFDVDGVLIRDNGYFSQAFAERHRLPADFLDVFFREDFPLAITGVADARERMASRLAGTKFEGRGDEVFDMWFDYNGILNTGILDTADRLRQAGYPVGLATNQERYRMEYLLDTLGLGEWFDATYPSYEIGYKKPDPRYFQWVNKAVYEKFGARQIHFVDDSIANVEAARDADWVAYLYDENAPQGIEKLEKAFAAYLPKEEN